GFHYEQGPDGGIVTLDDTTILDLAYEILEKESKALV
ncbi:MAG: DNA-binding protein, partial [Bacteroidetes bacterium HGW-Bacteroidetes-15]